MAFEKGQVPWNKGLKGVQTPWNKGIKYTDELKKCLDMHGLIKGRGLLKGKKLGYTPKRAFKKGQQTGSKHWNWKGGISSNNCLERARFKRDMQKLIFERDDYTCQLCGVKGIDLQIDHIQSWAEYVELRFSMDNCRTVCSKCHYQITFGKPMPKNVKGWGHNLLKGGDDL